MRISLLLPHTGRLRSAIAHIRSLIPLLVVAGMVTGCSNANVRHPLHGGTPPRISTAGVHRVVTTAGLMTGTSIQWNRHYAVTVKHLPMPFSRTYTGPGGVDVRFYRHASDHVPHWRVVHGRHARVYTFGYSPIVLTPQWGSGRMLGIHVMNEHSWVPARQWRYSTTMLLATAPIQQGMSGGAVFQDDGSVVGMIVGFMSPSRIRRIFKGQAKVSPADLDAGSYTIFVPYGVLLRQWNLFQRQRAREGMKPDYITRGSDGIHAVNQALSVLSNPGDDERALYQWFRRGARADDPKRPPSWGEGVWLAQSALPAAVNDDAWRHESLASDDPRHQDTRRRPGQPSSKSSPGTSSAVNQAR